MSSPCSVQSAKLTQAGGLFSTTPDPYLELIVDGHIVFNFYHLFDVVSFLCSVQSAKLTQVGGLFSTKPDPYLELIVDGQPPRKTEVVRKTTTPKWDEHFTV